MAKLKMKTVTIAALSKDRKKLIEHFQDSSIIQLKFSSSAEEGFERKDLTNQAGVFERNALNAEKALKILDSVNPEKKGLLSSFSGRKEIDSDEIGVIASSAAKIVSVCGRITELDKLIADNSAQQVRNRITISQLEPWKNLDIPFSCTGTKSSAVFIGSVQKQLDETALATALAEADKDLIFEYEIISSSKEITCFVVFAPEKMRERAETALRSIGYQKPVSSADILPKEESERLESENVRLIEESEKARQEIASFASKREEIEQAEDYFNIRADKYKVISKLDHSRHTFIIKGYVPENDCEKLEALCNRVSTCAVEFGDAGEDAPVKLKNNKFAEPAQGIVTMYSAPGRDDIDPTPILAFFFYFFFGMMFSDAGYGLLFTVITGILIKVCRPEEKMRNNLKLFQYCGISTFLWGLVYGSIFGDAIATFYNHFAGTSLTMADILPWPILDQQKDALTIMIISICFGLVHILIGMGCKFYICWRKGDKKGALFDTGLWMLMLIGFAVLAAGMKLGKLYMHIGEVIAIVSALGLVLTQGRDKKNIFGKVLGGVSSLYDVTGYISDLLSYSRLLALGLTTGVMAQVFNMLATMFGSKWWSFIPMVLIFVLGHLVNIGLNALGSYVHTMRLQYVEMFGKFYEGGGKEFEPFSLKSKYIRIQEEKKK